MDENSNLTPKPEEINKNYKGLFEDFEAAGKDKWKETAEISLKGKPLDKLKSLTYEGIEQQPIYTKEDLKGLQHINNNYPGYYPFLRGEKPLGTKLGSWIVSQEIFYNDTSGLNKALRHDLEKGLNAVNVCLDYASSHGLDPDGAEPREVGQNGVSVYSVDCLENIFRDIDIIRYPVNIYTKSSPLPVLSLFTAYLAENKINPAVVSGTLVCDPIAVLESEGTLPFTLPIMLDHLAAAILYAEKEMPKYKILNINSTIYNDSGANAVQETAFTLSKAVWYIQELHSRGIEIDAVLRHMQVSMTVGPIFFMEIAKLKTMRMLWANMTKAFEASVDMQKLALHAKTCNWNKGRLDTYTNILRNTNEALAAVIGGCSSLTVNHFDMAFGAPEEFSRRINRNLQVMLKDEFNLLDISDPAGGSWYIENITSELSKKAWKQFQDLESKGGFIEVLKSGETIKQINEISNKRFLNLSIRKDVMVGVNKYPNSDEKPIKTKSTDYGAFFESQNENYKKYLEQRDNSKINQGLQKLSVLKDVKEKLTLMNSLASEGATLGELTNSLLSDTQEMTIKEHLTEFSAHIAFEKLRDISEKYLKEKGTKPQVLLLTVGTVKNYKARADFSQDFFRVGGFEPVYSAEVSNADEAVSEAVKTKHKVVVLCSDDETYIKYAEEISRKLKTAVPKITIIMAGAPGDSEESFRRSGVDEFIHLRANILETLNSIQVKAGIGSSIDNYSVEK